MHNFLKVLLLGTVVVAGTCFVATPIPGYGGQNPFVNQVNDRIANGGIPTTPATPPADTRPIVTLGDDAGKAIFGDSYSVGTNQPIVQTPGDYIRSQNLSVDPHVTTTQTFDLGDGGIKTTVTGPVEAPDVFTATTTSPTGAVQVTQAVTPEGSAVTSSSFDVAGRTGELVRSGMPYDQAMQQANAEMYGIGAASGSNIGGAAAGGAGGGASMEQLVQQNLDAGMGPSEAYAAAMDSYNANISSGGPVANVDVAGRTGELVQQNLDAGMDPGDAYTKAMEQANAEVSNNGQVPADGVNDAPANASKAASAKAANGPLAPIEIFNVPQYILLILEAKEGQKTDDATKEVTVKGAEPMQQSQGSQGGGASMAPLPSSEMAGTTIAGAASAMVALLDLGQIDLSLLSTDIKKPEEGGKTAAVRASSSSSQADVSASEVETQSAVKKMTTSEQREIMHRRALLLSEWAAAALQIGEGSNAISSDFYARAAGFTAAASAAQGSMGGINTITDSDRFVLFELTRGAALSAVQLGLQGAENLNALDEVMEEPSSGGTSGVSISGNTSQ